MAYLGSAPLRSFGMRKIVLKAFLLLIREKFALNLSNLWVFREYVLKIALTRSIFQLKMHQIPFGGRAPPGSAGELTALPRPSS